MGQEAARAIGPLHPIGIRPQTALLLYDMPIGAVDKVDDLTCLAVGLYHLSRGVQCVVEGLQDNPSSTRMLDGNKAIRGVIAEGTLHPIGACVRCRIATVVPRKGRYASRFDQPDQVSVKPVLVRHLCPIRVDSLEHTAGGIALL